MDNSSTPCIVKAAAVNKWGSRECITCLVSSSWARHFWHRSGPRFGLSSWFGFWPEWRGLSGRIWVSRFRLRFCRRGRSRGRCLRLLFLLFTSRSCSLERWWLRSRWWSCRLLCRFGFRLRLCTGCPGSSLRPTLKYWLYDNKHDNNFTMKFHF